MGLIIDDIQFASEIRGFSVASTDTTSVMQANVPERIKAILDVRISWEAKANPGNGDTFTVVQIAGTKYSLTADSANFFEEGFREDDLFDFTNNIGPVTYSPQTLLLVSQNYIEFTNTGAIPAGVYTDANVNGTTVLDTLKFNYNLTDAANSNNLIQQLTNSIQGYKYEDLTAVGAFKTGNTIKPERGNSGTSQAKRSVATANYVQFFQIEHTFVVIPYYEDGQFVDLQNLVSPEPYRNSTLFYKQVLEFKNKVNGNKSKRIFDVDRPIQDLVGWRNENFDGGANEYTVESITYANETTSAVQTVLEATVINRVTIVLSTTNTFTTGDPIVLQHSILRDQDFAQNSTLDYIDTWLFESLVTTLDAVAVNGTMLTDFTAVLAVGEVTLSFLTTYTAGQQATIGNGEFYEFTAICEDPLLAAEDSNKVTLSLDAKALTDNADISGLMTVNSLEFYDEPAVYNIGATSGTTDLIVWNEDIFKFDLNFSMLTADDRIKVNNIYALIIAYKPVSFPTVDDYFEIQRTPIPFSELRNVLEGTNIVQNIRVDTNRGFLIQDTSQNNIVKLAKTTYSAPNQTYSAQMAIMVDWQNYLPLDTVDTIFFDDTKPNDNLNHKSSNYSELNGYEIRVAILHEMERNGVVTEYLNISPKIRTLDYGDDDGSGFTASFKTEDSSFVDTNLGIGVNELTILTVTFDDGNTKSFITFNSIVRLELKNQGFESSKYTISSEEDVLENQLLIPLPTLTVLEKSIVAGNFTVKCLIDGSFGTLIKGSKYTLSAEIRETLGNFYTTFDAVNEYVDLGNDSSLNFENNIAFSISAYIYITDTGTTRTIFAKQEVAGSGSGYAFRVGDDGTLTFLMVNSVSARINITSTNPVSFNTWVKVAITKSTSLLSSGCNMLVDGVDVPFGVTDDDLAGSTTTAVSAQIGARGAGVLFEGNIDKVSVWDKKLTVSEDNELITIGRVRNNYAVTTMAANRITVIEMDTLDPIDEVGPNDGTSVNMDASNIIQW